MSAHDMCDDRIWDADGTALGCMRSAGHWTRRGTPHYDADRCAGCGEVHDGTLPCSAQPH